MLGAAFHQGSPEPFRLPASKAYMARMARDAATTRNGCECMSSWRLQGKDECAEVGNAYCCNPNNDSAGMWCLTASQCRGETWDRCSPRPLNASLQIFGEGGHKLAQARLLAEFLGEDPFKEKAPILLRAAKPGEQAFVAPLTQQGCICAAANRTAPGGHRCSAKSGWCCRSPEHEGGEWCETVGDCAGRHWDHCTPATTNRAVFEL